MRTPSCLYVDKIVAHLCPPRASLLPAYNKPQEKNQERHFCRSGSIVCDKDILEINSNAIKAEK